ncbi:nitroreductase family protein [Micromonospora sp. NPDC050397]|uniref:nitroreductase family protein n=1 Tax=Micromonospora sp. NPDC050397 TaxID=3364279 RepID=UPI00384EBA12
MEFAQVVRARRMVRNYDPERPVPPEVLDRLLDHAVRAPSAGFSQGWGFLVLDDPTDRARFWAATAPDPHARGRWLTGMRRAPLIVVPHANKSAYLDRYAEPDKGWTDRDPDRWPVPYWHVDTGFAALLMLLTAVDEGLGGCFFGIPRERLAAYRAEFGVPDEFTPIGALTVGYRAPDHRSASLSRGRRPIDQVVHRGQWGGPFGGQAPERQ